jgi:uncharacterized protein
MARTQNELPLANSGIERGRVTTIGVVSDTHLPRFGKTLPVPLLRGLKKAGVQAIVHCGDLTEALALDLLHELAPVFAVAGNNDSKPLQRLLPKLRLLEVGSVRIGVVHGHAGRGRTTMDRAFNAFAEERVDAVLFGHSHIPFRFRRHGVLLFNPGSPTDKRMNPAYTYGILRISEGRVRAALHWYFSRKQ